MTTLDAIALAVSALTAVVGVFVAYQAFRGYRRNDSPKMRGLAVGLFLIVVVPYLLVYGVAEAFPAADAVGLTAALLSHTLGLLAIYRTLE